MLVNVYLRPNSLISCFLSCLASEIDQATRLFIFKIEFQVYFPSYAYLITLLCVYMCMYYMYVSLWLFVGCLHSLDWTTGRSKIKSLSLCHHL